MSDAWTSITDRLGELEALAGAAGVLEWDQQTYMPPGGASHRGQQLAVVSTLVHERLTDPRMAGWMDTVTQELERQPDPVQAAAVRNLRRRYERATRIPAGLVRALAEASSDGFSAWLKARTARSFEPFLPALDRLVRLSREAIACHGDAAHPYDHLLEEYDPGSTVAQLRPMFDRLAAELRALVQAIDGRPGPAPLALNLDTAGLERVSKRVLDAMGFRSEDGRLDPAQHPFTCGIGPHDVRLTTHYYGDDLLGTLGGTIHEGGHGLYEQGLPGEWAGTGLASAASFGLHESQSRFWENAIGRSRPFYRWLLPVLKQEWPGLELSADQLYGAANRVQADLIRVKADEATYNLHIIVRFQLETALVQGEIEAKDLPDAWDDHYERIVTVRPTSVVDGVLQDVHWASGLFGYFPSYTMGNLYAASFRRQMELDLPEMWTMVERGELAPILGWMREKVHKRGHIVDAPEIVRDAVGDRDPVADLVSHLRERQGALYGI